MKNRKITQEAFRPVLLASTIGLVCQTAFAQPAPEAHTTPFANRPLHLQRDSSTTSAYGVRPNVMFFVDDSGSMQALVGGRTEYDPAQDYDFRYSTRRPWSDYRVVLDYWNSNLGSWVRDPVTATWNALIRNNYANPVPCTFDVATLGTDNGCYRLGWPHTGYFRLRQQNNRIRITIDALTAVVDKYKDNWNWNIYTLWGSEERRLPERNGRPMWASVDHPFMKAAEMKEHIKGLSPTSNTPTTERYVKLARVMKDSIEYRCQKSYIIVMSDGDANAERIPDLNPWEERNYGKFIFDPEFRGSDRYSREFGGRNTYYEPYGRGVENGISLFSHILAKTDMKTRSDGVDKEGGHWDNYVGGSDPRYHNTKHTEQTIQTFTIGFGEGLSSNGEGYLHDAATCEGDKLNKCFFKPTTGAQLAEAFKVISDTIEAENTAGGSIVASSSTPATTGTDVAELAATLTLDTEKWASELLFIKLGPNGTPTRDTISPGYSGRKVLVNNGTNKYWLDAVTPVSARADFAINSEEEFKNGFVPWLTRDSRFSDMQIEAGLAGLPAASRTVKQYRNRAPRATDAARQMADVVDAPIRAFGKDIAGRQKYLVTAANDGMVYIFESDPSAGSSHPYELKLNYLPAGMQRESADQRLTVGKTIRLTAETGYGTNNNTQPHVYLNNGGISWAKTPATGGLGQEYILLGNMGQGGRGSYALTIGGEKRDNVTGMPVRTGLEGADLLRTVPLWETPKGVANQMGYTISTGQIAQIATKWNTDNPRKVDLSEGVRIYAFIANGYKSGNPAVPYDPSPTLYVYEMMGQDFGTGITRASGTSPVSGDVPGTLVTKIPVGTDAVTGASAGALASPTLLDNNLDGVADFAYAGDQFGNLYRFDLREEPSTWANKVRKIYRGDATQPITAAPALHRVSQDKYVIIFGTGSDIYDNDRTDINQQVILGIYDDLSVETPTILTANSNSILDQQLDTDDAAGQRKLSTNAFNPTLHKAWRIKLSPGHSDDSGKNVTAAEKVVVRPEMLVGTAFLTSRIYEYKQVITSLPPQADPQNTCFASKSEIDTSGSGWFMAINAETGSVPDKSKHGHIKQQVPDTNVIGEKIKGIPSAVIFASRQDGLQRLSSGALDSQGTIAPLGTDITSPDPKCVPVEFDLTLGIQSSDIDSPYIHFSGDAPRCKVGLIRTNWREVPL